MAAILFGVSFVVLLAMSGSVIIPIEATLLNVLSLSMTFGGLVWVYREGHLASVPALTQRAGNANGWPPAFLKRLSTRLGAHE